ncbi:DUF6461 domain-containing protein [Amycolatopsis sp. NPDC054798]
MSLDLVAEFGEAWCVTVVRERGPDEVLAKMGTTPGSIGSAAVEDVPFGVTDRELVLARALPGRDWTLAVELDGPTGFLGWRRELLAALSADGGAAGAAVFLPNVQEVSAAEDGRVAAVIDPLHSYRRSGADPDRFVGPMRDLGFRVDDQDDTAGAVRDLPPGALITLLLEVVTGVELDAAAFAGPWRGGTVRFDERGQTVRFTGR